MANGNQLAWEARKVPKDLQLVGTFGAGGPQPLPSHAEADAGSALPVVTGTFGKKKSACSFSEGKPQFSFRIAALGAARVSIPTQRLLWVAAARSGAEPAARSLHRQLTAASVADHLSESSHGEAHNKAKGEFSVWHVKLCCISTLTSVQSE